MNRAIKVVGLAVVGVICLAALLQVVLPEPPSCPNHNYPVVTPAHDTFTVVPLAGEITDIPEFHDCQRMLAKGEKTLSYGPLVGIWVAEFLDDRLYELAKMNTSNGTALAFAQLYSWDGPYPELGIRERWNCLYLYPAPDTFRLLGKMVQVKDRNGCLEPKKVATLTGDTVTDLHVKRLTYPGLKGPDYPPVARWDWDQVNSKQYIGLKCGEAWCEVTRSEHYQPSRQYAVAAATGEGWRVHGVKGWYDEQVLAMGQTNWFSSLFSSFFPIKPAGFLGTIVPDPALDGMTRAQFSNWVPAGYVVVGESSPKYEDPFNYGRGVMPDGHNPGNMAKVSLCNGILCGFPMTCQWPEGREPGWYAMIEFEGRVQYRCVDRVDHRKEGRKIPGAARWYWEAKDEKGWWGCAEGCCTVR